MNPDVKEITAEDRRIVCGYCHKHEIKSLEWGPMYSLDNVHVHYFCMLFSAGLSQNGEDEDGILGFLPKDIKKELKRGEKLKCKFCKGTRATIGCSVKTCKASYHYPCGLDNGSVFHFIGNYESYCNTHKEKVCIPLPQSEWECPICFCVVNEDENPLWPPCCKKRVFHKVCILQMAKSHGAHFFKCPLCNDRDKFSVAMRKSGVYLPDRDAAWEMEPNAFAEHQRLYEKCDAVVCECEEGREYNSKDDSEPYKVVRCGACGASAIHKKCGKLKNLTWRCPTCSDILLDKRKSDASFLNNSRIQRHNYMSSDDEDDNIPVIPPKDVISSIPVQISNSSGGEESGPETKKVVFNEFYRRKFVLESSDEEEEEEECFVSSSARIRRKKNLRRKNARARTSQSRTNDSEFSPGNVSNPVRAVSPGEISPIAFPPVERGSLINVNSKASLKNVNKKVSVDANPEIVKESVSSRNLRISLKSHDSPTQDSQSDSLGGLRKKMRLLSHTESQELQPSSSKDVAMQSEQSEQPVVNLESDDSSDLEIVQEKIVPKPFTSAAVLDILEKCNGSSTRPVTPAIRLGVDDDETDHIDYTENFNALKPGNYFSTFRSSTVAFPAQSISQAFLKVINREKDRASRKHFSGRVAPKHGKSGPDRDVEIVELDSDDNQSSEAGGSSQGAGQVQTKSRTKKRDKMSPTHRPRSKKDSTDSRIKRQRK